MAKVVYWTLGVLGELGVESSFAEMDLMAQGWRERYPGGARVAAGFAILAIVMLAIAPIGAALGFIPWQVSVLMFLGGVAIYAGIKAADRWL